MSDDLETVRDAMKATTWETVDGKIVQAPDHKMRLMAVMLLVYGSGNLPEWCLKEIDYAAETIEKLRLSPAAQAILRLLLDGQSGNQS